MIKKEDAGSCLLAESTPEADAYISGKLVLDEVVEVLTHPGI